MPIHRLRLPHPAAVRIAVDIAVAVGFLAVCCYELGHHLEDGPYRSTFAVNVSLDVAFCTALALRRTAPVTALVGMLASCLLPSILTQHTLLFFGNEVPLLLATYTVARRSPGWAGRLAWLSGPVFWLGLVARAGHDMHLVVDPVLPVVLGVAAWIVGRVLRRLAEQRIELAAALDRLSAQEGERQQWAVARERSRIAAEMHDVVASTVGLMVVQVGNARLHLERSSGPQPSLRAAESAGRQALTELRRSLGVLHTEPGLARPTRLDELPALAQRARSDGLVVEMSPVPETSDVAPALQLAAVRVLDQALADARPHGSAVIGVRRDAGCLVVSVRTPAPGGPAARDAATLTIRARVELFGGVLRRQEQGGSVLLEASFPLAEQRSVTTS